MIVFHHPARKSHAKPAASSLNKVSNDTSKVPLGLLGLLQDLLAFLGQLRPATISSCLLEEDWLPSLVVLLALACLFTLCLLKLDFDLRCM